jgi:hypothetical protein
MEMTYMMTHSKMVKPGTGTNNEERRVMKSVTSNK